MNHKELSLILGASLALGLSSTSFAQTDNPFKAQKLASGYNTLAQNDTNSNGNETGDVNENDDKNGKEEKKEDKKGDGKCGAGKCGAGKCG